MKTKYWIRNLRVLYGFIKAKLGYAEWVALPEQKVINDQDHGWAHKSIVNLQVKKWEPFRKAIASDPAALLINHESSENFWGDDLFFQNQILCFGHALAMASAGKKRLSWLDYGGGLGQYHLYAKTLFPSLIQDYTCFDLPIFKQTATSLNLEGRYLSDKMTALSDQYDFVFAGSSLWYDDNWKDVLGKLARCAPYLMVARQLMVEKVPSFIVRQRATKHGYLTDYQSWVLNRNEFIKIAQEKGLKLLREYHLNDLTYVYRAHEHPRFESFLFGKKG